MQGTCHHDSSTRGAFTSSRRDAQYFVSIYLRVEMVEVILFSLTEVSCRGTVEIRPLPAE